MKRKDLVVGQDVAISSHPHNPAVSVIRATVLDTYPWTGNGFAETTVIVDGREYTVRNLTRTDPGPGRREVLVAMYYSEEPGSQPSVWTVMQNEIVGPWDIEKPKHDAFLAQWQAENAARQARDEQNIALGNALAAALGIRYENKTYASSGEPAKMLVPVAVLAELMDRAGYTVPQPPSDDRD